MKKGILIIGKVKSGLGKGSSFMSQPGYKKQFIKKLGIDPYYGTLNLKLTGHYARKLGMIRKKKAILVKGFMSKRRRFGDVLCYRAEISGIKCSVVMPKLSVHKDVAEIISSDKLRRSLRLKEGSRVKVSVAA